MTERHRPRSKGSNNEAAAVAAHKKETELVGAAVYQRFLEEIKQSNKLEDQIYYHGVLPREEINFLLQKNGDFIVRESIKGNDSQIVLSVYWHGQKHFIVQQEDEYNAAGEVQRKVFRLEAAGYTSVAKLVYDIFHSRQPVTERSGALLLRPIRRAKWQINNDDITLEKVLGKGNFGEVWKGKLRTMEDHETVVMDVAVKTCHRDVPEEEKQKFLREARIMRQYSHPNIVQLIGICADKIPMMIIMELVDGGALNTYLRKNKMRTTLQERIVFCIDGAAGMEYLEMHQCIHRDLASRNCLLTTQSRMLKIADFGMSREGAQYEVSGHKQIPIKWTAPEAVTTGVFSTKSDVWSFGVLIWEIFCDAAMPYPNMSNKDTVTAITKEGYRMPAPAGCPDEISEIMMKSWAHLPHARPSFKQIRRMLLEAIGKYSAAPIIEISKDKQRDDSADNQNVGSNTRSPRK